MATELVTPDLQIEDPEHFELLDGAMVRKMSVGRKKHSDLDLIIRELLMPIAKGMGALVAQK